MFVKKMFVVKSQNVYIYPLISLLVLLLSFEMSLSKQCIWCIRMFKIEEISPRDLELQIRML